MKKHQVNYVVVSAAKAIAAIAFISVAAGCTTTQSVLDGTPFQRADPKLLPVTISKIDGNSRSGNPVMVDPGRHVITLSAAPALAGRTTVDRSFTVDIGKCERVTFGARRESPLMDAFVPVVVEREPLTGCKAAS